MILELVMQLCGLYAMVEMCQPIDMLPFTIVFNHIRWYSCMVISGQDFFALFTCESSAKLFFILRVRLYNARPIHLL